jgi:hypothetical protein
MNFKAIQRNSLKRQPASKLLPGSVLRRRCSCGNHTISGGECESCEKRKTASQAQRRASAANSRSEVPPIVDDVLRSPGQPLDATTRAFFEPRFAHNFSCAGVRPLDQAATQRSPITIGPANDRHEDEADRMASAVMQRQPGRDETSAVSQNRFRGLNSAALSANVPPDRSSPGPAIDFSQVRVHADTSAAESAQAIDAAAYTVGSDIVFGAGQYSPHTTPGRNLLAHELTHVAQQAAGPRSGAGSVQRKVILKGAEMGAKERADFIKKEKWSKTGLEHEVIEDMALAGDAFDFANEDELHLEIVKRTSTVKHMKESQETTGDIPANRRSAFGYPFTGDSVFYGPRVNFAAREYWEPDVPDKYAVRTDKTKNKELLKKPRKERCLVYGDQCKPYGWQLSAKGKADPYKAIVELFVPQPPHKRTLIHCDHLVSLVNFRSMADAIGVPEFNKRIKAFGTDKIFLKWNAFSDLHVRTFETSRVGDPLKGPKGALIPEKGLASTQRVQPTSEANFVIGDHVVFFNHLGYDLINEKIGNAWRLENAVLVRKDARGQDVFLGHGSGYKSAAQLRAKLAQEFNEVAKKALAVIAKASSTNKKTQAEGLSELAVKFPNVKKVGNKWRAQGVPDLLSGCKHNLDVEVREIKPSEVLGPKSPCDPSVMNAVERPIESAK